MTTILIMNKPLKSNIARHFFIVSRIILDLTEKADQCSDKIIITSVYDVRLWTPRKKSEKARSGTNLQRPNVQTVRRN